jgi:predicted ArsR family transcriptional regulator
MSKNETNDRILQATLRLEATGKRMIADIEIATALGIDKQVVNDHLEALKREGYVTLATHNGEGKQSHIATLTGEGRIRARELEAGTTNDGELSILVTKKRRLRLLEGQQAAKGHNTPPEITIEIEDLRKELGESTD